MPTAYESGHVERVRVRLACSRGLEEPAHDVFLLETGTGDGATRFDEGPYLADLAPLLSPAGPPANRWEVHVGRTHRSWVSGAGEAEITILLATGRSSHLAPGAAELVRAAFRRVLARSPAGDVPVRVLDQGREEVIAAARHSVAKADPAVATDQLVLTEEDHIPAEGMWSVGLMQPGVAWFEVLLGFVDGVPGTAHIRRTTAIEVVDSVGTDSA